MKIFKIVEAIQGNMFGPNVDVYKEYQSVFSSDLMSDCLALINENCILITGLTNIQSLRTAEMLDIDFIVYVRGTIPTPEMIDISYENNITLVSTKLSMFETSGILYKNGMKPISI